MPLYVHICVSSMCATRRSAFPAASPSDKIFSRPSTSVCQSLETAMCLQTDCCTLLTTFKKRIPVPSFDIQNQEKLKIYSPVSSQISAKPFKVVMCMATARRRLSEVAMIVVARKHANRFNYKSLRCLFST